MVGQLGGLSTKTLLVGPATSGPPCLHNDNHRPDGDDRPHAEHADERKPVELGHSSPLHQQPRQVTRPSRRRSAVVQPTARVVERCAEVRLLPLVLMLLAVVLCVLVRVLFCRGRQQAPQPYEHGPPRRERGHASAASLGYKSGQSADSAKADIGQISTLLALADICKRRNGKALGL